MGLILLCRSGIKITVSNHCVLELHISPLFTLSTFNIDYQAHVLCF